MEWQTSMSLLRKKEEGADQTSDHYHSVEFSVNGRAYQFKIWHNKPLSLSVLVREDSEIINLLKVGDRIPMKYYPIKPAYSPTSIETAVRQMTKSEEGKFKGHYIVDLEMVDGRALGGGQMMNTLSA
ncbi:MAG: hypothetical protein SV775_01775 [Thermodesulfobacteriota bacterium]|nr:hypothetical protein [Thermodesulfobacteriota bacterium]